MGRIVDQWTCAKARLCQHYARVSDLCQRTHDEIRHACGQLVDGEFGPVVRSAGGYGRPVRLLSWTAVDDASLVVCSASFCVEGPSMEHTCARLRDVIALADALEAITPEILRQWFEESMQITEDAQ